MSFTNMDSKEANVESAPAYSGVIPQIQYESMGSPLRREAEEKEDELSQRNQMKPVKRNLEPIATKLQPNKKSKKKEKEKSQDGGGSFTVSDPPSRTSKRHSKKTHTKQKPSVFRGLIRFEGFYETGASTTSKYLRCAPDTKADTIWDIMINKWHMERPQLVISVYCDSVHNLTDEFQEKFKWFLKGLYTWIITNEIAASDCLSLTSECKNDVVVVGVAPWGCVANRQALEGEEDQTPKKYLKRDGQQFNKNGILNESYSHFILIDDGTENKFGGEIDFRTNLEKFISEQSVNSDDKESSQTIPVISFAMGGRLNTMKMVSLSVNNGIPVVIIPDGGATKFIAQGMDFINVSEYLDSGSYSYMSDNTKEDIFCCDFDEIMKEYALKMFKFKKKHLSTFLDNSMMWLRQALQHYQLLTILENLREIDNCFSTIQFKDDRSTTKFRLIIALAWKIYDLPKTLRCLEITSSERLILHDAMLTALKKNSVEFLTKSPMDCHHLNRNFGTNCRYDLLRDIYKNCIVDENDVSAKFVNNLIKKFVTSPGHLHPIPIEAVVNELYGSKMVHKRHAVEEFFIITILMNRMSMARHFWRIGTDHIENALFASCLLKGLSKKAYDEDELELSLTFTQHSSEFEKLASEVLGFCGEKNRLLSHQLLVRELSEFGNTTLFCLADENNLMDFMGQTCCQTKLNAIWKGHMALYTSSIKIVASILIPFLIPAVKFVDKKAIRDGYDDLAPLHSTEEDLKMEQDDLTVGKDSPEKLTSSNGKVAPIQDSKKKILKQKFKTVTLCGGGHDESGGLNLFRAIFFFYTAPVTKFTTAMFANIVFLGMFSFFVLTDLHPIGENGAPSLVEIFSWIYTITSAIEECRQVLTRDQRSVWYKIRSWYGSVWNRFDFLMYLFFFTSVILRLSLYGEDFIWARMLYSLTLGMYFIRFMHFFYAEKNIGPKVIMISRMLTDLMFFLLILLVFILSFGVAYQANLYPNAPQQWTVLKDVLYHPYWQMYGELFLENKEGNDPSEEAGTCTNNETLWRSGEMDRCPEKNAMVVLLMVTYMLLTNILLVNLLIAMFSDTFQKVQDNSEKVWRFHRFSLVYEYYERPALFPPLIILNHMYRAIRWLIVRCSKCCSDGIHTRNSFKLKLSEKDLNRLSLFERGAMEEYMHSVFSLENDKIDKKIQTTSERLDRIIQELDNIKDNVMVKERSFGMEAPNTARSTSISNIDTEVYSSRKTHSQLEVEMDQLSNFVRENMLALNSSVLRLEKLVLASTRQQKQQQTLDITNMQSET